jgi:hypothetical protein
MQYLYKVSLYACHVTKQVRNFNRIHKLNGYLVQFPREHGRMK